MIMRDQPMHKFLAIDLGGTKTSVSIGNKSGHLYAVNRFPTEATTSPDRWLERLTGIVEQTFQEASLSQSDLKSVGLAVPGPMNVATGMVTAPPNMPAWRNVPVKSWVESRFGLPVSINNDANAAALAEYYFGEFKNTPDLVYLTMSTGIGGGIVSGGRLLQGANDLAGEVGHIVLDPQGPSCPCGQRGCFEMYCGGRNVIEQIKKRIENGETSQLLQTTDHDLEKLTVTAIAKAAGQGDLLALEFWERFIDRLAQGVGIVTMCFNPSAIIMGTIAIHLGNQLIDPLHAKLARFAWPQALEHLKIRPSALGTRIGDLGALALAVSAE